MAPGQAVEQVVAGRAREAVTAAEGLRLAVAVCSPGNVLQRTLSVWDLELPCSYTVRHIHAPQVIGDPGEPIAIVFLG